MARASSSRHLLAASACLGVARRPSSAAWPVSVDEHVVERRPVQLDVVDRRRPPSSSRRTASAIMPERRRIGRADDAVLDRRPLDGHLGQRGDRAARRRARSSSVTSSRSPPICAFSSSEVPSAITLPWSITTMLVGEPVGLVEVLGREQHGRAAGDAALDRLPQAEPAARVEPGRRLVEEQHRRAEHERGREVEPPAHAAGVGLRGPLGGVGELEALEQLVARARAPPRGGMW